MLYNNSSDSSDSRDSSDSSDRSGSSGPCFPMCLVTKSTYNKCAVVSLPACVLVILDNALVQLSALLNDAIMQLLVIFAAKISARLNALLNGTLIQLLGVLDTKVFPGEIKSNLLDFLNAKTESHTTILQESC